MNAVDQEIKALILAQVPEIEEAPTPEQLQERCETALRKAVSASALADTAGRQDFEALKTFLIASIEAPITRAQLAIIVTAAYTAKGLDAAGKVAVTLCNACQYLAFGKPKAAKSTGVEIKAIGIPEVIAKIESADNWRDLRKALTQRAKPDGEQKTEAVKAEVEAEKVLAGDLGAILALARKVISQATALLAESPEARDKPLFEALYAAERVLASRKA